MQSRDSVYNHFDQTHYDLVDKVLEFGTRKPNRTGMDTISLFGECYKVDVSSDAFPISTSNKFFWM